MMNRVERDNIGAKRRLPEGRDCKSSKNRGGGLYLALLISSRCLIRTITKPVIRA
jgi:hypothetical protein